jgi:hypothetical protein
MKFPWPRVNLVVHKQDDSTMTLEHAADPKHMTDLLLHHPDVKQVERQEPGDDGVFRTIARFFPSGGRTKHSKK